MENLIDIYTKLKLHIGSKINITYLTSDNKTHQLDAILLDVYDFASIYIGTKEELLSLPFISSKIIIKSISIQNQPTPIYYNQYIDSINSPFQNYQELKNKIFNQETINQENLKIINKIINTYLARYEMVSYEKLFFSKKQQEEFETFFNLLIKELSNYARNNGYNPTLKQISTGTTSIVYELGDKIIKIGKPRRLNSIPYCEYILQPIVNKIFEFDGYPIHIEVTQKVYTPKNQNGLAYASNDKQFNEIVNTLKENLKQIGLQSEDLHPANVGILLKDNKIHYDDIYYETADENSTSIINNNNHKILPKGNYVIIDLDSLKIIDYDKYNQYLKNIKTIKTLTKKREI